MQQITVITKAREWIVFLAALICSCNSAPKSPSAQNTAPSPAQTITSIQLLPYLGFDSTLLPWLQQEITSFYQLPVKILPAAALPRMAWYAPRQRYKADSLLVYQQGLALPGTTIAGFSHADISTSKNSTINDWGVFGLGYCPGRACVISTWRLQKAGNNRVQLQERLIKVVLHELGHNLGLPHCKVSPTCLMADAGGTLAQVDREQKALCTNCQKKYRLD